MTKLLTAAACGVAVITVASAALGGETTRQAAVAKCKPGYKAATIGGKRICLKAGQRCVRSRDTQYHRYGFHCHSGQLTKKKTTVTPPPPPPPPLPGRKVDIGGYKLYLHCMGTGSPTVVLEVGLGGAASAPLSPQSSFQAFQAGVSADTRLCVYDRGGLGASDPRPGRVVPTAARYGDELHALLGAANVPGPYVLVGASFGGLVTLAHVAQYPSDYVGLVFLDALGMCGGCQYPEPELSDFRDLGTPALGDRPVVALVVNYGLDGQSLASRSTSSILASVPGSSHFILPDRPQLVVEAVRIVVAAVRAGAKLAPCEQTPLPAAGAKCETTTP